MLGPGCLGIANAVLTGLGGLGLMAQDILEGLAKASQESVALHVPAGTSACALPGTSRSRCGTRPMSARQSLCTPGPWARFFWPLRTDKIVVSCSPG